MSYYNLHRPTINVQHQLTEEEQYEWYNLFSDSEHSDSDDVNEMVDDDDDESDDNLSDYGEQDTDVLEDIRMTELRRYIEEEHNIEAEEVTEEPSKVEQSNRGEKYIGQGKNDKTIWWSVPSQSQMERTQNMKRGRMNSFPCIKQTFNEKKDAFVRILPPAIVGWIVIETNRKARRAYYASNKHGGNHSKKMRKWIDTDVDEIYAYIAILLFDGAEKSNNVQAKDLFHKSNMPFYRAVMTLDRFEELTRFMRFDDFRTRAARLRDNKLAPIQHVWSLFLVHLTFDYEPSLELCVGEQLLTTGDRCNFRQHIPLKSGIVSPFLFVRCHLVPLFNARL